MRAEPLPGSSLRLESYRHHPFRQVLATEGGCDLTVELNFSFPFMIRGSKLYNFWTLY